METKAIWKRVLASLLTMVMVVNMVPVTALAAPVEGTTVKTESSAVKPEEIPGYVWVKVSEKTDCKHDAHSSDCYSEKIYEKCNHTSDEEHTGVVKIGEIVSMDWGSGIIVNEQHPAFDVVEAVLNDLRTNGGCTGTHLGQDGSSVKCKGDIAVMFHFDQILGLKVCYTADTSSELICGHGDAHTLECKYCEWTLVKKQCAKVSVTHNNIVHAEYLNQLTKDYLMQIKGADGKEPKHISFVLDLGVELTTTVRPVLTAVVDFSQAGINSTLLDIVLFALQGADGQMTVSELLADAGKIKDALVGAGLDFTTPEAGTIDAKLMEEALKAVYAVVEKFGEYGEIKVKLVNNEGKVAITDSGRYVVGAVTVDELYYTAANATVVTVIGKTVVDVKDTTITESEAAGYTVFDMITGGEYQIAITDDGEGHINILVPEKWEIETAGCDIEAIIDEILGEIEAAEEVVKGYNVSATIDAVIAELEALKSNTSISEGTKATIGAVIVALKVDTTKIPAEVKAQIKSINKADLDEVAVAVLDRTIALIEGAEAVAKEQAKALIEIEQELKQALRDVYVKTITVNGEEVYTLGEYDVYAIGFDPYNVPDMDCGVLTIKADVVTPTPTPTTPVGPTPTPTTPVGPTPTPTTPVGPTPTPTTPVGPTPTPTTPVGPTPTPTTPVGPTPTPTTPVGPTPTPTTPVGPTPTTAPTTTPGGGSNPDTSDNTMAGFWTVAAVASVSMLGVVLFIRKKAEEMM